jgi:hypothetical protein
MIGTATVNIRTFGPQWDQDDPKAEPNCPLDKEHVKEIVEIIITNLMIAHGPIESAAV